MTKRQAGRMADWLTERAAELRAEANRLAQEAQAANLSRYGRGYDEALAADQRARDLQWQADEASTRARALMHEANLLLQPQEVEASNGAS